MTSQTANSITYERMTHEGVKVLRTYTFSDKDFSYQHTVTLQNEGNAGQEIQLDLQMTGKQMGDAASGMMSPMGTSLGASCHGDDGEHHRWNFLI